jgi:hypothetical protein
VKQAEHGHRDIHADPEHRDRILQRLTLDRTEVVELVDARKADREQQQIERPRVDDAQQADRCDDQADDDAPLG